MFSQLQKINPIGCSTEVCLIVLVHWLKHHKQLVSFSIKAVLRQWCTVLASNRLPTTINNLFVDCKHKYKHWNDAKMEDSIYQWLKNDLAQLLWFFLSVVTCLLGTIAMVSSVCCYMSTWQHCPPLRTLYHQTFIWYVYFNLNIAQGFCNWILGICWVIVESLLSHCWFCFSEKLCQ